MRKLVLFFVVLLSVSMCLAQDIMIDSFRLLDTDLTANTSGTIVLDQNGEKCALIKVSTSQTDFTFDAGMMGIVKQIQKTGEIWLYVPSGVKRLSISHVGMETLRDQDLGMSVQKACTYLLTLKTSKDVDLQTVTFKVSPSSAVVMIESIDKDSDFGKQSIPLSSNGEGSTKIPIGEYRYTAIANGYNVEEGTFTLTASAPRKIIMELAPLDGIAPVEPIAVAPTTPNVASPEISPSNLTFIVNGVSFKMIYVEGGTFTMGATSEQVKSANIDEKPAHEVTLSSYHIGETEVTQELWEAVMGSNPSKSKCPSNPVEMVSRDDCQDFISRLNKLTGKKFRLPTEAEWEYAARGGNKSNGYKYSGSNDLSAVAWYGQSPYGSAHFVSTKSPNELGIYDMSGNVYEFCCDKYGKYPSEHVKNPTGPSFGENHVIRGGSCRSASLTCRVSFRAHDLPSMRDSSFGLRLGL